MTSSPRPTLDDLRRSERDERRRLMLDAAADLVAREGIEKLTVRAVAQAIGASTQVVYSWFGSKEALVAGVYAHALERHGEALAAVTTEGSTELETLVALAMSYRAWALANPRLYEVLARGRADGDGGRIRESTAFHTLVEAVGRACDAGQLAGDDHVAIADALWAYTHGAVTLELAGYHDSPAQAGERFVRGGMALLRGLGRA